MLQGLERGACSILALVAGVEGLEPPTPGFGDRCSSQLSYTPRRAASLSHDRDRQRKGGRNLTPAPRRCASKRSTSTLGGADQCTEHSLPRSLSALPA